ncbi:MAG TPA: hypothetical protein VJK54_06855, partial [Chthoniobacterales bacterium]|nr:hypothetical protein [Chthoniobacterales bacterium]
QADYQAKASEAQENGKEALAAGYREVALISEKAAELREQEAQKKALGKIDEGVNYGVEGECLQLQADYNIKAIEAEEAGKVILATGYREAAETSQRAAGIKHQAGEAIASGKEYVGNSLSWVGQSLKLKAEYQAKIIIAREAGKEVLAVRYREVVETSQKASEYYQQAADIFALEKINEGYNDYLVGEYLRSKAEYQAEVAEKAEEESEKSVIKKTDKIISSLIRGNGNFNSMKSKALFVYCEKWLAEGGPINISDYVINVLHTLKKSADYKLIRSYEEYRNNVWEAHKLGDDFLAFSLIQVVEDIQQAIEDSIQQAKASENNNSKLSDAWKNVVQVGQKLAECRDRYIQISVRAQSHEIVSGWKKIVETSEFIVDYHRKAAEACALNNEQDYNRFNNAGDSMIESVTKLEEAVTAFGKSLSLSNEPELAEAWKKVAEEYQRSAEFDEKVAEEELQGNKEEVARLTAAAKASQETAKALENEAKASEKK